MVKKVSPNNNNNNNNNNNKIRKQAQERERERERVCGRESGVVLMAGKTASPPICTVCAY